MTHPVLYAAIGFGGTAAVFAMAQAEQINVPSTLTDPVILAGAFVTVIAALAAAVVTIINAKSQADERREARFAREEQTRIAKETEKKVDAVAENTVKIHETTNSNLSKVTASLETALSRIEGLQDLVRSMTEAKRVADALASKPEIAPPAAEVSLQAIERHTEATAENTARTDEAVKDLTDKQP